MYNFLDLFSGIGAFPLGAHWAGITWKTHFNSDIESYANEIYQKRFPDSINIGDIKQANIRDLLRITGDWVVVGGPPCPAFSVAGKGGGFDQDDLFFDMFKVCEKIQPKIILIENVEGFTKWKEVLHNEIEAIGYEWADAIIDARDFGIPQARRRYFAICIRRGNLSGTQHIWRVQGEESKSIHGLLSNFTNSERRWTPTIKTKDGWRDVFANARRVRANTRTPHRMDRLRCIGNSIPPQMTGVIFLYLKLKGFL